MLCLGGLTKADTKMKKKNWSTSLSFVGWESDKWNVRERTVCISLSI